RPDDRDTQAHVADGRQQPNGSTFSRTEQAGREEHRHIQSGTHALCGIDAAGPGQGGDACQEQGSAEDGETASVRVPKTVKAAHTTPLICIVGSSEWGRTPPAAD